MKHLRHLRTAVMVALTVTAPVQALQSWLSQPGTVGSGTPYTIGVTDDYSDYIDLYRDGGHVGTGTIWDVPYYTTSSTLYREYTDFGAQNITYEAYSYDWGHGGQYGHQVVTIAMPTTPAAAVSVDGLGSGAKVWRPHGGSAAVTVRYQATDPNGDLTGIRPQYWHQPTGDFNNNGGTFVGQSGGSGEVAWTLNLDKSGNWYFWTDARDVPHESAGTHVNSGAWDGGFRVEVNEAPSLSMEVLDASQNVIAPGGDGKVRMMSNSTFYVRLNATDSDDGILSVYVRMINPSGNNVNWLDSDPPAGITSTVFGPFNLNNHSGTWDLWAHSREHNSVDWGTASGFNGNSHGWTTIDGPDIEAFSNQPPRTESASAPGCTFGQTMQLSGRATDPEGSLAWMDFYVTGPNMPGWNHVGGATLNGGDATALLNWTPNAPGGWGMHIRAHDSSNTWDTNANITHYFTVARPASPTNDLTAPATVYVGGGIALNHTANNPTSISTYQIGFKIHERREDSNGVTYQDWTELNHIALSAGNRAWSGQRLAPDRPGRIIYQIRSWNQWMGDSENLREVVVQVPNRAPSISLTASPATINYGQSAQVAASASDPDGNLYATAIMRYDGTYRRPSGTDYARTGWNVYGTESGWSAASFTDDGASGASATKTISYLPSGVGSHSFHANAYDGAVWTAGGGATTTLTVNKTTPATSFGNVATAEGVQLTSAQLNAVFTNSYNPGFSVPGTVSYVIVGGGVAPYSNDTALYVGQLLPTGTFTVRVSVPASANYNEGMKDVTFIVSANPNADNDGDGFSNATEALLGTNPNIPASNDPAALQLKINTPRP